MRRRTMMPSSSLTKIFKLLLSMKKPIKKRYPSLLSFDDDFKKRMKNKAYRVGFEKEKLRLDIALLLIDLRKKKKMSQKSLAEKIGTSQSAIARIESGNGNFTVNTLGKIAATFHKNVKISFI